tara:strand:- start:677 stop:1486 length:810 start_codon:yes stop_codon:yes gene_type:complete
MGLLFTTPSVSRYFGISDTDSTDLQGFTTHGRLLISDGSNGTPAGYPGGITDWYNGPDESVQTAGDQHPIVAYTNRDFEGNHVLFNSIGVNNEGAAGETFGTANTAYVAFKRLDVIPEDESIAKLIDTIQLLKTIGSNGSFVTAQPPTTWASCMAQLELLNAWTNYPEPGATPNEYVYYDAISCGSEYPFVIKVKTVNLAVADNQVWFDQRVGESFSQLYINLDLGAGYTPADPSQERYFRVTQLSTTTTSNQEWSDFQNKYDCDGNPG